MKYYDAWYPSSYLQH